MRTEVAIIGGGTAGCFAAFFLAEQGRKVTLMEKDNGVGLQASGRAAGGVRQHQRTTALPIAMAAVQLWSGLAQALQAELEYVQTGNLVIVLDDESAAILEQKTAWERDHGLRDVRMMTAAECHAMVPSLTDQVTAGKYCASDGSANPMLVTPAIARAAQRAGAKIMTGTQVTGLLISGGQVTGVTTDHGDIQADYVINAAGPWASKFNEQVGCHSPIKPGRSQLLITEILPRRLEPWLGTMGKGYMRQAVACNIIFGIGGLPNETYQQHVDFPSLQQYAKNMCEVLPWLKDVALVRTFAGITEYTPDAEPYIGPVPGVGGLFVAAGFHGQGFCIGPMAAKILAELIDGRESPVSLAPFQPDRFGPHAKSTSKTVSYPGERASEGH